jgi:hypothetical protein
MVTAQCENMAGEDTSFWQQTVMTFLKEEISTLDIHAQLQCPYRNACMGVSSVKVRD